MNGGSIQDVGVSFRMESAKDSLMRTGCFVKMCQEKLLKLNFAVLSRLYFNLLTLSSILFIFTANFAQAGSIFGQEKTNTYLRWNLFSNRDQLQINRVGSKVLIKTLNYNLFQNLKMEFQATQFEANYISHIKYNDQDQNNVYVIDINLKNENVEIFSFYREREKKYVVDFWVEGDAASITKIDNKKINSNDISEMTEDAVGIKMAQKEVVQPVITKPVVLPKAKEVGNINEKNKKTRKVSNINEDAVKNEKVIEQVKEDKILSSIIIDPSKKSEKTAAELELEAEDSKKPFRDFRYGATLVWDYDPIVPIYKGVVNLKTKIPEVFYSIANRDFKKSEKEAHLQLTINLYRKKKWGLMYKSMKLFQSKYGQNTEWETIEFMKINAMLRENIDIPNPDLFKNAIAMLEVLGEKTDNYELKKAINKYLLTHYQEKGETLKVLQTAKNYYAGTRDNFDFEESVIPAEAMLNSLAKLGQIEKIKELSQEKTIKKILPAQLLLAYQTYAHLKVNDLTGLVALFERIKPSLVKPIEPVILYNTAEAYFRLGKYEVAMQMYKDFVEEYSHEFVAANASLRIALCSDLLDRNYNETLEFYKKAIDTALDSNVNYEARIRYVAFRTVRKKKLDAADLETRIFLEQSKSNNATLDKNLSRLLQQTRLRTLIVDQKYKEALAYLSLIPMIAMPKIEARAFDGDGAEIVYGLMTEKYKNAEYAQVIKFWQAYKDQYLDKVALDPFINFIVGSSYVKLGLYKGFDELYAAFEKLKDTPNRTFPIWVERQSVGKAENLLAELSIVKDLKLKNYDLASKNIANFEKKIPGYNKTNYYKGIISFNQKDYKATVSHLENFFSKQDQRIIYDPADIADMIRAYTDSIYELGDKDKFLKVSEAILNDTNSVGTNNAYIQNVRERIAYLGIEIVKGKNTAESSLEVEKKIVDFKKVYPKSIYLGRVNFLLGQTFIQNKKVKEGKEMLSELVNDKNVSDYIKELAKSELSLINLKEKTL